MKKILTVLALFSMSAGISAAEVSCGGTKYLSSPYPGASTKLSFSISASEEEKSIEWSTKNRTRERSTFELTSLDHNRTDAVFRIEGIDANGDAVKAFIRYLTPDGVKLTLKLPGERWNSFRCSGILVDE